MNYKKQLNISFSVARVFAVLSIVSDHVTIESPEGVSRMRNSVGSIGVIIFIILSGYFYHTEKYSSVFAMLRDKAKSVVIPWIVMGSLTYLYNAAAGSGFDIKNWLLWIIGYKTFLYYLTMLILCYLIFFKRNRATIYASFLITLASVYLTAFGVLDSTVEALHITNYLNILNWVGYFAFGCLMQEFGHENIFKFLSKTKYIFVGVFVLCYVLICVFDIRTGYFSYVGLPYQLLGATAMAGISTVNVFDKKIIHNISNMTFGVYLLHMPIVGLFDRVYNITAVTKLFAPMIVTVICLIILYVGYWISNSIKLNKLYAIVTGVRLDRNIKEK